MGDVFLENVEEERGSGKRWVDWFDGFWEELEDGSWVSYKRRNGVEK